MHGLKNPIAGLEAFLEERRQDESAPPAGAWSEANATARRMRTMVNEVVDLLREEQSSTVFELTGQELLESVAARVSELANAKQVAINLKADEKVRLTSRQAGLVMAIMVNLTQNACEALPKCQGIISLVARHASDETMEFRVTDNGLGLPAEIARNPFQPKQSLKPGGAGIGLAISRQLSIHLGGNLELETNGSTGASFCLTVPYNR
jgi:signal transduction histidine kinase